MDSMRSLNTSLPRTSKPKSAPAPDVHQSFRSAALTVTTLYKAALADIEKSRSEGYQEAIEDLLGFLDKQNLGLDDGEGWKVRQWATERLDGALPAQSNNSDSDDDAQEGKRARSSSPVMERQSPELVRASEPPSADATQRSDSAPPPQADTQTNTSSSDFEMHPPQAMFSFQSNHAYPTESNNNPDLPIPARRTLTASRRTARTSNRSVCRPNGSGLFSLGTGAGQKRKVPFMDFFNLDTFGDRRDGPGGGPKRGRLS